MLQHANLYSSLNPEGKKHLKTLSTQQRRLVSSTVTTIRTDSLSLYHVVTDTCKSLMWPRVENCLNRSCAVKYINRTNQIKGKPN